MRGDDLVRGASVLLASQMRGETRTDNYWHSVAVVRQGHTCYILYLPSQLEECQKDTGSETRSA